jgi:hypothetical protein
LLRHDADLSHHLQSADHEVQARWIDGGEDKQC